MWLFRLDTTFVFHRRGAMFIYVRTIQTSKIYMINKKKSNRWTSICCRIEVVCIIITIIISNV